MKRPSRALFSAWEIVLITLICALLVCALGVSILRASWLEVHDEIAVRTDLVYQQLTQQLSVANAAVASLANLYQSSEPMSSTELTAIAQGFLADYPYLETLYYLAWTNHAERADLERAMRQEGFTQFHIKEYDLTGRDVIAQQREAYLPITFLEPLRPQTAAYLGMDMLTAPELDGVLKHAVESADTLISPARLKTVQQSGLAMVKATYFGYFVPQSKAQRFEQVSGLFLLVLDLEKMIAQIRADYPKLGIELTLITANDASAVMLSSLPPLISNDRLSSWLRPVYVERALSLRGGTQLALNVYSHIGRRDLDIGLFVLLMTLMGTLIVIALCGWRYRRLALRKQRAYQKALYREKERAEVTLQSIGDAVITTDVRHQIHYMNPVAKQLLKQTGDVRGRHIADVVRLVDGKKQRALMNPADDVLEQLAKAQNPILVCPDQTTVAVQLTVSRLHNHAGQIAGAVLVVRNVSRERELAAELCRQAKHDQLTELPNRRFFEESLRAFIDQSRRLGSSHVLCYFDLDQFKLVNDTCGHSAGDQMLRQIAALLEARLRKNDLLARLGGDEFGLLLRDCNVEQALKSVERLRKCLGEFRFHWQDKVFSVSASFGIVPILEACGSDSDILSAADMACYAAKDRGRNCIHVYKHDDQMIYQRHSEMQWHTRIQNALDEDRFVLYSQKIRPINPQYRSTPLREFLLRMVNCKGKLIPPMMFMPAAERYDLMPQIDRWVINRALSMIKSDKKGTASTVFTINLSGDSIDDPTLADYIIERLRHYAVTPARLCFEITETAAVSNLKQASRLMVKLRELGCRFALDDFGTGLSSFAYLKQLPVDYLKIDSQFVRDIDQDRVDLEMVKSISGIGRIMKLLIVAEGVENQQTLDLLRDIGIDYAQGFHIHRPEPFCQAKGKRTLSIFHQQGDATA